MDLIRTSAGKKPARKTPASCLPRLF